MCLIVLKPKGANNSLTEERFNAALKRNPHGIGIAYSDGGKIVVEKYATPQDKAKEIYQKIADKDAYLIHFRYATHGAKNEENVHPFLIVDGLYVAHNGVLSKYPELNKEWSDTRNFTEGVIRPYIQKHGKESFKSKEFIDFIEKEIGSGNKMVFVDDNLDYSIANEGAGSWVDGCWYSNTYSIQTYTDYYKNYTGNTYAGNYYDSYYDDYTSNDDYDYLHDYYGYERGGYTRGEILNYVADYVEDNNLENYDDIPYEVDLDRSSYSKDDEDRYLADLKNIADQMRNGRTSGQTPVPWEIKFDESVMEYLTTKPEEEPEDEEVAKRRAEYLKQYEEAQKSLYYEINKNGLTVYKDNSFSPAQKSYITMLLDGPIPVSECNESAKKEMDGLIQRGLVTILKSKSVNAYTLTDEIEKYFA